MNKTMYKEVRHCCKCIMFDKSGKYNQTGKGLCTISGEEKCNFSSCAKVSEINQHVYNAMVYRKMVDLLCEAEQYNGFDPDYPVSAIYDDYEKRAVEELKNEGKL